MIPRTGPVAKLRRTGQPRPGADAAPGWHVPDRICQASGVNTLSMPLTTLDAVLERITYANQETGYTVARVATDRSSDLLAVVGPLLGAQPGERLRLRGRWKGHPRYGRQFEVHSYQTVLPATIQGIRRYLGSGLIKGIGPRMAERIVDLFAETTLQVIEQEPSRLVEVPVLGPSAPP
jgi:exodeoxyribonuclease V alpha subunit